MPMTLRFTSLLTKKTAPSVGGCCSLYSKYLRLAAHNSMALNPNKSETCMFDVNHRVQLLKSITPVTMAGASITLSDDIKNLDITNDTSLMSDQHTRNICKTSYFHM